MTALVPEERPRLHPAVYDAHRVRLAAHPFAALIVISTFARPRPALTAALLAVALITPWVVLAMAKRSHDSRRTAHQFVLVEAMILGLYAGLTSFRVVPAFTFFIIAGTLSLTIGGIRHLLRALLMFTLGFAAAFLFAPFHPDAPTGNITLVLCALFLLVTSWLTSFLVDHSSQRFHSIRRDLHARNTELEESNQIARLLSSTLDLDDVMRAAMRALQRLFAFDQMTVFRLDPDGNCLVLDRQLGSGFRDEGLEELKRSRVPLDEEGSHLAAVVNQRQRLLVPRFTQEAVAAMSPADRRIFDLSPVKALLVYPLEVEGEIIGVIAFGNTRAPFEPDDDLFAEIGRSVSQVATSFRNARLFDAAERAREAALEADRGRVSLLGNIGQELRRPLNTIVGGADRLRSTSASRENGAAEELSAISEAGQRLRSLVEDLIAVSRIETSQMSFSLETIAVEDLVRSGIDAARPMAGERRAFEVTVDPLSGSMQTDTAKARVALLAVLARAVQATDAGTVFVNASRRAAASGDRIVITVRDEGSGLSGEGAARLFDDLSTPPDGDPRGVPGLGLARGFCRLMGGDLSVRAQLGRGSLYTIDLPARLGGPGPDRELRDEPDAIDEDDGDAEVLSGTLVDASIPELLDQLHASELVGGTAESALQRLAVDLETRLYEPGETVAEAGSRADRLFLVLRGRLRASLPRPGGTPLTIDDSLAGETAGEVALHGSARRSLGIEAVEESWVGCLHRSEMERLADDDPDVAARLGDLAARHLLRTQLATRLRSAFGELDDDAIGRLMNDSERIVLRSGETLFTQGDPADAAFLVLNGRLEVEVERDGETTAVAEIGRGESVGEMAILTGGVRSAAVRALRDSELARIPRAVFERLVWSSPRASVELTRTLATRLERSFSTRVRRESQPATFAVVPATPDVPLEECARRLAEALGTYGSTELVDSIRCDAGLGRRGIAQITDQESTHVRLAQWLGELESSSRFVVYQTDRSWTAWTHRAIRQADRVIVVARSDRPSGQGEIEQTIRSAWKGSYPPRTDLVLLHEAAAAEPVGTAAWLDDRDVDRHFHARRGSAADFARIARILTGNALGLVLGGGGARSFAHIGVIRALEELGMQIDMIGGTSFGAVMAAAWAIGNGSRGVMKLAEDYCSDSLIDFTPPVIALLRGRRINHALQAGFGDRQIEDLWSPFFCISTNLTRAEAIVHDRGSLLRSTRASLAIPGVIPPVVENGDVLVDGGLLNNVPADVMRSLVGAGRVVAVDVSAAVVLRADPDPGIEPSGLGLLWDHLGHRADQSRRPTIGGILNRATVVESARSRSRVIRSGQADLYITLPLPGFGMMEFKRFAPLAQLGYSGSIDQLRAWVEGTSEAAAPVRMAG